ncbi:MAG: shikimate 5-dehydrogenase, partial [Frankiales bacterium]|nr:shikimate 5-dehydrogenase [Frankiales bacterium]
PLGMAPDEGLAFTAEDVRTAAAVLDVVAVPPETPLVRLARAHGVRVRTGAEVIALQAAEQFFLYTGRRPTAGQVRRASEWSRSG